MSWNIFWHFIVPIWMIGWVAFTYPFYKAMANSEGKNHIEVTESHIMDSALFGSVAALFWFLAMPFFISHALHRRRLRFKIDTERVERTTEGASANTARRRQITDAKELLGIEVKSHQEVKESLRETYSDRLGW